VRFYESCSHVNRHLANRKVKDMTKSTRNSGTRWTPTEVKQLRTEAAGNTPTRVMGIKHGRTPEAIQSKAEEIGLSLKPTNQSPYNRRKD